jgi:CubicO group peptidase (beta-lactamase class C family)
MRRDAEIKARAGALLETSIRSGLFSGAALAMTSPDSTTVLYAGAHSFSDGDRAIGKSSLFDLASVTKVVVTSTAILQLVERRVIDLDQHVADVLPSYRTPRKRYITIADLLCHMAGFNGRAPLYRTIKDKDQLLEAFLTQEPAYVNGSRRIYDDVSYVSLGRIVEEVTNQALDKYGAQHIFEPADMRNTKYCPQDDEAARCVSTEVDPARGGLLRGVVHDENAYYLGGVTGHAGLFSTAEDLAAFCRQIFFGGSLLEEPSVDLMLRPRWQDATGSYAIGWDLSRPSYMGDLAGNGSFGHTGFTGTSIVGSMALQKVVVLLTNFVHPGRKDRGLINDVRARIVEAAFC